MNISNLLHNIPKLIKSNSPEILTALGVSGVVTTAYLTGKATFKAVKIIQDAESVETKESESVEKYDDSKDQLKRRIRLVWKCYIPAGICGGLTIGFIIGSSKVNNRRTAAAVTAYSLTERAFSEYKEKIVEQLGKGKEQKIRDELAQENVSKKPPLAKDVIVVGPGYILCCELFTGRYFRSTMEKLQKAKNEINSHIINDMYVSLDEFYDLIGLSSTSNSGNIGWDSDKLMELVFSTVISEGGEPCLAFEYSYVRPLK